MRTRMILLIFIALLPLGQYALDQGCTLTAEPSANKLVLGEPLDVHLKFVWNETVRLQHEIWPTDIEVTVTGPSGTVVLPSGMLVQGCRPFVLPPEAEFKAGDQTDVEMRQVAALNLCAPGTYSLRFRLAMATYEWSKRQYWQGQALSAPIEVVIEAPAGKDAGVWALFERSDQQWQKMRGMGYKDCNLFHLWLGREGETVLARFPTSTYAGHVLLGHGPGGSLLDASVLTPEKRDLEWHVPTGATPAKQEEWRKTARASYESFAKKARAFLCIHPDFAEQALLRRELATALFNVDKPDEAWIEVEALAKLEGQWADEARVCLRKKTVKP